MLAARMQGVWMVQCTAMQGVAGQCAALTACGQEEVVDALLCALLGVQSRGEACNSTAESMGMENNYMCEHLRQLTGT